MLARSRARSALRRRRQRRTGTGDGDSGRGGNPTYGSILTDADGSTLYTWEGDEPGDSYCADQCAAVWPPLLVSDSPVASSNLPGALGMIERDDGGLQATFNDWPLYYFSGDPQPGDSNGQAPGVRCPLVDRGDRAPAPPPVAALPTPGGPALGTRVAPRPRRVRALRPAPASAVTSDRATGAVGHVTSPTSRFSRPR